MFRLQPPPPGPPPCLHPSSLWPLMTELPSPAHLGCRRPRTLYHPWWLPCAHSHFESGAFQTPPTVAALSSSWDPELFLKHGPAPGSDDGGPNCPERGWRLTGGSERGRKRGGGGCRAGGSTAGSPGPAQRGRGLPSPPRVREAAAVPKSPCLSPDPEVTSHALSSLISFPGYHPLLILQSPR